MIGKYCVHLLDVANLGRAVGAKPFVYFAVHKDYVALHNGLVDHRVGVVGEDVHDPRVRNILIRHLAGSGRRSPNWILQAWNHRPGKIDRLTRRYIKAGNVGGRSPPLSQHMILERLISVGWSNGSQHVKRVRMYAFLVSTNYLKVQRYQSKSSLWLYGILF